MKPTSREDSNEGLLLADAHVHFQACFDEDAFFSAAVANLTRSVHRGRRSLGYLMMTEMHDAFHFQRWKERAGERVAGRWAVSLTEEPVSLIVSGGHEVSLVVVAGRQIRTADGLEVLALGTERTFRAGASFEDTLQEARAHAAIVCVPWGFGKWWFGRGQTVLRMVDSIQRGVTVGDSAGRPRFLSGGRVFSAARRRGIPILHGSDPLPLHWHQDRVGSAGFSVPGDVDTERPLARLLEAIRSGRPIEPYGERNGLLSFLVDQTAIRVSGLTGGGGAGSWVGLAE